MAASGIAIVSTELRSHFLDGLAPSACERILGAATQRRFRANSVVTNHGHPADHLFLLTKGLVRFFVITDEGRKASLSVALGPRDLFRRNDCFVGPFFLSLQYGNRNGHLGVGVGPSYNPRPYRTPSQVAGERVGNCVRLSGFSIWSPI